MVLIPLLLSSGAMARYGPWLAALACLLLWLPAATVVEAKLDKTVCCERGGRLQCTGGLASGSACPPPN